MSAANRRPLDNLVVKYDAESLKHQCLVVLNIVDLKTARQTMT